MMPPKSKIEDQLNKATEDPNKFPGMSYGEGVEAALRWILGGWPQPPMDD